MNRARLDRQIARARQGLHPERAPLAIGALGEVELQRLADIADWVDEMHLCGRKFGVGPSEDGQCIRAVIEELFQLRAKVKQ